MKSFAIITTALTGITLVGAQNDVICNNKAPAVVNAITRFCNNFGDTLMVPGTNGDAEAGISSEGDFTHTARVGVNAICDPPEWIPQEYCFEQFYAMCASGDSDGQKLYRYGGDGCQQWWISHPWTGTPY